MAKTDKRTTGVADGLKQLVGWLEDQVRGGLGQLGSLGPEPFERQAARMSDAKAGGLASWLRALVDVPASGPDWERRLLGEFGRMTLLAEAFGRLETLPPALADDVRQRIGWTVKKAEVLASCESVVDVWVALGHRVEFAGQGQSRRTWLMGRGTGRAALLLDFAFGRTPFPPALPHGREGAVELRFYPSAFPLRAVVVGEAFDTLPLSARLTGHATLTAARAAFAAALGRQPWLDQLPVVLTDVTLRPRPWRVVDRELRSAPLDGPEPWAALAASGGEAIDLWAESAGDRLRPLMAVVGERLFPLGDDDDGSDK